MPDFLKGNAQQFFHAFGQDWAIAEQKDDTKTILRDLPSFHFLGTVKQAISFFNIWYKKVQGKYYLQGNMSAGNLSYLFGRDPLKKEEEDVEIYHQNLVRLDFGYVNDAGESCGIMVMYRKDNPKQWIIGLIKNTQAEPKDREVICITSFDLKPYIKNFDPQLSLSTVSSTHSLLAHIHSAIPTFLLQNAVDSHNEINLRFQRIVLLMRQFQIEGETATLRNPIPFNELNLSTLFADNPILDLILQYKLFDELPLSINLLKDILSESSQLQKEIKGVKFTANEEINKRLLKILLVFYDKGILEQNRPFLANIDCVNRFKGFMWHETQIQLLPFLIQKNYPDPLIQIILSEEAYFRAIHSLVELEPELTQDVPQFFADPTKLEELKFIHSLPDENTKRLCLIFWVKGALSIDGYQQIVEAAKEYPLMASSLVALDKTKTVSIEKLQEIALDPSRHLRKSIAYHFSKELQKFHGVNSKLHLLNLQELKSASTALLVLKKAKHGKAADYLSVLENDSNGRALRLLLPQLEKFEGDTLKVLIDVLFEGIRKVIPTQGYEVLNIDDKEQLSLAKSLQERFICVMQMQDLKLSQEIIELSAQEDTEKAQRFRQVILRVEAQCKKIHERFYSSDSYRDTLAKWKIEEESYRKNIYKITYEALKGNNMDAHNQLKKAEDAILKIVDPEIESDFYRVIYNILLVVANIVISAITLFGANAVKYHYTGNFWFFNQSSSGEEIRALDKEALKLMDINKGEEYDTWSILSSNPMC